MCLAAVLWALLCQTLRVFVNWIEGNMVLCPHILENIWIRSSFQTSPKTIWAQFTSMTSLSSISVSAHIRVIMATFGQNCLYVKRLRRQGEVFIGIFYPVAIFISCSGCSPVDPWVEYWQGQSTLGWFEIPLLVVIQNPGLQNSRKL